MPESYAHSIASFEEPSFFETDDESLHESNASPFRSPQARTIRPDSEMMSSTSSPDPVTIKSGCSAAGERPQPSKAPKNLCLKHKVTGDDSSSHLCDLSNDEEKVETSAAAKALIKDSTAM